MSPDEAAVLANREFFGRLCTAAMLPAVETACREWRPDLILHEPCEYASAVVAARHGIPQAQVGISLAAIEASSLGLAEPALARYGHETVERLRSAPYLTRFPASLDPSPFAATRRFRETGEKTEPLPDWWGGSTAPLVYLTFGSVVSSSPAAAAAFRTALDAVDGLPVRVLLTVGRAVDPAALGPVPANVHVEPWVPQADVLGSADVVVCHGGSGTTFGALAAGVPLVVVPLFADQPANGRLVEAAGAGLLVAPSGGAPGTMGVPGPDDVPRIRAAVEAVLADASYRAAAQRIAAEVGMLPTVGEVLGEVQSLA
ncbi:nucleotide disphospho-sugar-binding domain-containing protein [Kitasatospora sp. MAA4]|uniref:glycosyltransferase n=1 Tax=Kitasatospora sp. MAA4 TaxID=3035093 RepID=UPI0024756BA9|nr:nucleotide disphospho-sugar-binding domain-containing protein [Kitasatospora sp. MAA4]